MVSRVSTVNTKSLGPIFLAYLFSVTQTMLLEGHIHDSSHSPTAGVAQRHTGLGVQSRICHLYGLWPLSPYLYKGNNDFLSVSLGKNE